MKKKVFIFLLNISLLLIILPQVNTQAITGETVTGEATTSNVAISVSLTGLPSLSLLSPENKTYLSNGSILLNFTVSSEDFVGYSLDGGSNTTITSSIFINVTQGAHTLLLYANNSQGTRTKNVIFTANSTVFIISYNEYFGSNKGNSTDFNASTYEDIQNLSGIVLENTTHGKITFSVAINLTNDLNPSDLLLDLDNNTNISSNRIELNSTALPNFNKPARIYLYNLTFDNPRPLRDGSVCSSSICTEVSYLGGTFIFDVTQFTVYSAGETPADEAAGETLPAPSPSGGGPGGRGLSFSTNIGEIKISLKQGETKSEEIKIKNQRDTKLLFSISSDIGELVKIREENFELAPKEEKTIIIDFIAKENAVPDLYLGNLLIRIKDEQKSIPITIEVESKEALFDVRLDIPEGYLEVYPGEELISEIEIFNLVETGKVNVTVEYLIKDQQNREIISEEEILSVEKFVSFEKKFEIPESIEPGRYILYVRITYNGKVASASILFNIIKESLKESLFIRNIILLIIGLLLFILIIIIILKHKSQKQEKLADRLSKVQKIKHELGEI